jgi:hypothetical protein
MEPIDNTIPHIAEPSLIARLGAFASAASLLRMAGALTVVAAMSAFLLQDWAAGTDMTRFYMLLSQTGLLAVGGFGLSYLLKENKGARVFFGLGLLSTCANMATLGALVFSVTQWGSVLGHYPAYATWQADGSTLGLASLAALVVAAPVALLGYMVLTRRSAPLLAGLFLFGNLLLLVPVRESLLVGILAVVGVAVPLLALARRMPEDATLRTPEGWFAIATLFVPVAIMISRSLWLYEADAMLSLMLSGIGFVLLRAIVLQLDAGGIRTLLTWGAAAFSLQAAFSAAPLAETLFGIQGYCTTFALVFTALMCELSRHNASTKAAFIGLAGLVLSVSHLLAMWELGSVISSVLCITAGIGSFSLGKLHAKRPLLVLGAGTVFAGVAQQVYSIMLLVDFGSWITLAVLGASAIIGASVIERHGAVLLHRWNQLTNRDA